MEHAKLVQVITSIIKNRQDPRASDRPEDYDIDAIARETHQQTVREGVDELDPESYWRIVEKHARQ